MKFKDLFKIGFTINAVTLSFAILFGSIVSISSHTVDIRSSVGNRFFHSYKQLLCFMVLFVCLFVYFFTSGTRFHSKLSAITTTGTSNDRNLDRLPFLRSEINLSPSFAKHYKNRKKNSTNKPSFRFLIILKNTGCVFRKLSCLTTKINEVVAEQTWRT